MSELVSVSTGREVGSKRINNKRRQQTSCRFSTLIMKRPSDVLQEHAELRSVFSSLNQQLKKRATTSLMKMNMMNC
ncbi:hypothetical protein F2P81_015864 [Scophthalmus maximus]|uniref:Uncharacterized protein n=1 Tax=Scophthalmus maximus TaxID=52904 RepID=A0A6A4SFP4_SCOMX|nr:hypothetical protein F2P81_015864 [Scophthalmus maximus]